MAVSSTKLDDKCYVFWDKLTESTGSLSFNEFYKSLKKNGVELSLIALKKQWDIIDTDSSDDMDLSEFKTLIKANFEASDHKIIVQNAFNKIYIALFPNDKSDLLSYRTETPRITNKNVKVVLNKNTMKQNKAFQKALDKKLSDIFHAIDVDQSGTLEFNEMWQAVELLEIPISYQDLKLTYDFFDTDKNGHIEEDEFKRWMNSQITKYWSDNPDNNQFVALQRALLFTDSETIQSTRESKKSFKFDFDDDIKENKNKKIDKMNGIQEMEDEEDEDENTENYLFSKCTVSDVESWDIDMIGDYINYLFGDKQYDRCRDQYVAIFMTHDIDGKKFMKLERKQISHMGVTTAKGKRHVSVIKNAQRHIKQR